MSSQTTLSSQQAGENAESAVLEAVPALEYVPDSEAGHYDARTTTPVTSSETLPFAEISVLEADSEVEIKSTMAVYGEKQRRGRFYLRQKQHERLEADEGVYLFAVCEPRPDRNVIAMKILPATAVGDLPYSWIERDGRPDYAQFAWSRVFDPSEVER